jgi:hypothetical protein
MITDDLIRATIMNRAIEFATRPNPLLARLLKNLPPLTRTELFKRRWLHRFYRARDAWRVLRGEMYAASYED